MAVVILASCAKESEDPSSSQADYTNQSKSSSDLAKRISNSDAMEQLIIISNSIASESLISGYEQYLNVDPNSIISETELLNFYSNIFTDEVSAYDKIKGLRYNAYNLRDSFPELNRMNDVQLNSVLSEAYNLYLEANPVAAGAACTDPSCAESTAIGALFCLPALAAVG